MILGMAKESLGAWVPREEPQCPSTFKMTAMFATQHRYHHRLAENMDDCSDTGIYRDGRRKDMVKLGTGRFRRM